MIIKSEQGNIYGTVGTITKFKDINKIQLFVGDIVEIFAPDGKSYGNHFVVEENGEQYIMSLYDVCEAS